MNQKSELNLRRWRVKPLVDEIKTWEWEVLDKCPICNTTDRTIVTKRDRYGFDARLAICNGCGIGYLVERLSKESYSRLYEGAYRQLLSCFSQKNIDLDFIKRHNQHYAEKLIRLIGNDLLLTSRSSVLDIGGSTGAVSYEIWKQWGTKPIVLDPSNDELEEARSKGLETVEGTIESADLEDQKFDLIILCRTAEHVYDLKRTLERIQNMLRPNGLLYIDYLDLVEHAYQDGSVEATTRLDHCFYYYKEMIPALFSQFGFKIKATYVNSTLGHMFEYINITSQEVQKDVLAYFTRELLHLELEWYRLPVKINLHDRIQYRLSRILHGGPIRGPG